MSLNRQQRRKLMKKGMAETVLHDALQEGREDIKKQCSQEAVTYTWVLVMQALHDKFGFGKERIKRVQDAVEGYSESISAGDANIQQFMECLNRECGLEFMALRDGSQVERKGR
jgi:type I site-specific restriction-modification system R (restriction) subunit